GAFSDEDKAITSRIADSFMKEILPQESVDALSDMQLNALDQFARMHPEATKDDLKKFHDDYIKSDDFYNATLAQLPTGLKWASQNQAWANRISGLGLRPDQTSASDEAIQILGGALVGLPQTSVTKLTRPIVSAIGERAAKSIPARVAART